MAEAEKPPITELGLLGLLALLWGSSYYFAKIALVDLPPMTLAASRVAIAAVFLLIIMRIVGDKLPRDGRTWRMLFVQACFNSILSWSILAWGQQHIDVALASVLNSTSPIFVFFITLALVRKAPPGRSLWGACVGLGGVALIVGGDLADGVDASLAGCAAALIGAFLYGCAAVYGKRITGPSSLATATGTMLWQRWRLFRSPRWSMRLGGSSRGRTRCMQRRSKACSALARRSCCSSACNARLVLWA